MRGRQDVEFKTIDGVTLRGWLYTASVRGPGIVMTPGFNMTKETIINDVAEYYFSKEFTVLSYDPRSIGRSDGEPRNESNPAKMMEDYMDALTFLKMQATVDPARIAYWGYSFSGMVALCATALDKRASAVVTCAPLTLWTYTKWKAVLAKCMKDRESRLAGNAPIKVPMLDEMGRQPAGFGEGFEHEGVQNIISRAVELQPSFLAETSLSTYYHIAAFQPFELLRYVTPTPAFICYGVDDQVSPPSLQKELIYDVLSEPKELLEVENKAHMNLVSGQGSETVLDRQMDFLARVWLKDNGQ